MCIVSYSKIDDIQENNTRCGEALNIPFLAYVAGLSTLFPVVTGGIRFRGLNREFRILLIVFFLEVLSALLQIVLAFQGINNLFLGHFYLLVFFVLFWILSHVFFERLDQPAYYSSILSKVFYTGISIVFLHRISSTSD